MFRILALLIPAIALGAAPSVALAADAMSPGQARVAALGEARAVTFYTVDQGGAFRVVTTIAVSEVAMPVRAIVTLEPGQTASISVPGPYGSVPYEVTFRRNGDRLSLEATPLQDAALR